MLPTRRGRDEIPVGTSKLRRPSKEMLRTLTLAPTSGASLAGIATALNTLSGTGREQAVDTDETHELELRGDGGIFIIRVTLDEVVPISTLALVVARGRGSTAPGSSSCSHLVEYEAGKK